MTGVNRAILGILAGGYALTATPGCARSHLHEGYQPATTKETVAAQEKSQINSLDRALEAAAHRMQTSGEDTPTVATSDAQVASPAY